jgi:hypothetical protein
LISDRSLGGSSHKIALLSFESRNTALTVRIVVDTTVIDNLRASSIEFCLVVAQLIMYTSYGMFILPNSWEILK